MGLDCIVFPKARPGHEEEWRRLMEAMYNDETQSDAVKERRREISMMPYESVGVPMIGKDPAADRWALENREPEDRGLSDDEYLEKYKGVFVRPLFVDEIDGFPKYTHAGLYERVDETSFRGSFLSECEDIAEDVDISFAWTALMRPEEAVEFGNKLLSAAAKARDQYADALAAEAAQKEEPDEARGREAERPPEPEPEPPPPPPPPTFWQRLFGITPKAPEPRRPPQTSGEGLEIVESNLTHKIDVLESAGKWYVFWGSRGHPIWAYF